MKYIVFYLQLKVVAADDPKSLWAVASDAHAGMTTALFCSGDSIVYTGGKELI